MSDDTINHLRNFDIFVDLEASGLAEDSYPIEIGISGEDIKYEALILPAENWTHWDSKSQKLHRISRKKLEKEGKTIHEVCNELNTLLKGKTIYCDSKFDPFWLDRLFGSAKIEPQFYYKNILRMIPEALFQKLVYELPQGERIVHRAFADADDLRDAWIRVVNWIEKHMTK